MSRASTILRDFVYLDEERLRSLAAQLFKGLPEKASKEKGHEVGTEAEVAGGLLGLFKARATGDYRYARSESETRSFHHHVYSLFEEQLKKNGLLTEIDADFDFNNWKEDFFHDGQFIRVVGLVRLMDYDWLARMLEAIPSMLEAVQYTEKSILKKMKDDQEITQQEFDTKMQEQESQRRQIKSLPFSRISDLTRGLYENAIRIKVLPKLDLVDKVFVGTGHPDNFSDTYDSIVQKYGYEVNANWFAVGQVNISAVSAEPKSIPVGNDMEDAFETLALYANDLVRIARATRFPAVSFTPISIYRLSTPNSFISP